MLASTCPHGTLGGAAGPGATTHVLDGHPISEGVDPRQCDSPALSQGHGHAVST
jgi:hypothetical protein